MFALPVVCALLLAAAAPLARGWPGLFWTFVGSATLLLAWTATLLVSGRRQGRTFGLDVVLRPQHWVQACAQLVIVLYWGWYSRSVYAFLPFIAVQLIFAYGVDALIAWSRRDRYALGFGPFPVILSINLFLWFRPEWFYWQFAMILVGYAAKELIRWNRDGRSAHIFNPSSFPLGVASLLLIVAGASDITFGAQIATTQFLPPHIYLLIFLVSLPGQILFGVARMTMAAVVTLFLISEAYLRLAGTYLFFDSHISLPVFLGMHLLFTDPSTSPRTGRGRLVFGVLYAVGITVFFALLREIGAPTFYDKLLPVPLMNLSVRAIDRLVAKRPSSAAARPGWQLNLGYTSLWAIIFLGLSAIRGLGDTHPGQALPYWLARCANGSDRACEYTDAITLVYCDNGSGWACYEWGIMQLEAGRSPGRAFALACERAFPIACDYTDRNARGAPPPPRPPPLLADLPIVLRGSKLPLRERDPARLYAIACAQGWPGTCERTASGG